MQEKKEMLLLVRILQPWKFTTRGCQFRRNFKIEEKDLLLTKFSML